MPLTILCLVDSPTGPTQTIKHTQEGSVTPGLIQASYRRGIFTLTWTLVTTQA